MQFSSSFRLNLARNYSGLPLLSEIPRSFKSHWFCQILSIQRAYRISVLFEWKLQWTSMHSSRMRTARMHCAGGRGMLSRGVCSKGGGFCLWSQGVCLWSRGGASQHAIRQTPPVNRILDTLLKILPCPNFVACGNKLNFMSRQREDLFTVFTVQEPVCHACCPCSARHSVTALFRSAVGVRVTLPAAWV